MEEQQLKHAAFDVYDNDYFKEEVGDANISEQEETDNIVENKKSWISCRNILWKHYMPQTVEKIQANKEQRDTEFYRLQINIIQKKLKVQGI